MANGGYSGFEVEAGGSLGGRHSESYFNDTSPDGVYHLVIETGGGGWLPHVFFEIFISSAVKQETAPRIPDDDRVRATLSTSNQVQLSWQPSTTSGVKYCIYYHKEDDVDYSFVHSSTCSTHYTHAGTVKKCTTNPNFKVVGLVPGTTYNFNVVMTVPPSTIRSVYRGVQVGTLNTSDLVGKWAVIGRMETDVLTDRQIKGSYVKENHERQYDFLVGHPNKVIRFIVKPCGGFMEWIITAPNGTIIQQESFAGTDLSGVSMNGNLPRVSTDMTISNPQFGIYQITVRGGTHMSDPSSYVYFHLFVTTDVNTHYYPELPKDDRIKVVEHSVDSVTISWSPSPTQDVNYCVFYHDVKYGQQDFVYSSSCSAHYTSVSIHGPCVTGTTVTLANRTSNSLIYSGSSYYINVVVKKPSVSSFRSAYKAVLVSLIDPTLSPSVTASDVAASEPVTRPPKPVTSETKSSEAGCSSTLASFILTITAFLVLL